MIEDFGDIHTIQKSLVQLVQGFTAGTIIILTSNCVALPNILYNNGVIDKTKKIVGVPKGVPNTEDGY